MLFDLSKSMKAACTENKEALAVSIQQIPAGTCATALGITEHSFGAPTILLRRHCIPRPEYLLDARPAEERAAIAKEWDGHAREMRCDRPQTDILGGISYIAVLAGGRPGAKRITIWTDGRNTTRINIAGPQISVSDALASLGRKMPFPNLGGAKVRMLGVSTANRDERYFLDLKRFWTLFFERCNARLILFSPAADPNEAEGAAEP
jgi:hypothetical protein